MDPISGFQFQQDSHQSSWVCVLNQRMMKPCASGFLNLYKPKCRWTGIHSMDRCVEFVLCECGKEESQCEQDWPFRDP